MYMYTHKLTEISIHLIVDRKSGHVGKIRVGCPDRTQDRNGAGHDTAMARDGGEGKRWCQMKREGKEISWMGRREKERILV